MILTCSDGNCTNYGVDIEVDNGGTRVICGPCGSVLLEQASWYVPEEEGASMAYEAIQDLTKGEREQLIALLTDL